MPGDSQLEKNTHRKPSENTGNTLDLIRNRGTGRESSRGKGDFMARFMKRQAADIEDFRQHYTPPEYDWHEIEHAQRISQEVFNKGLDDLTPEDIAKKTVRLINDAGKEGLPREKIRQILREQHMLSIAISQKVPEQDRMHFDAQVDQISQRLAQE